MAIGKFLIAGVPFVSYSQARRWLDPDRDTVHPSVPASAVMVQKYWADEPEHSAPLGDSMPETHSDWKRGEAVDLKKGGAGCIDDLKARIADGYPVVLSSGLTPVGHPITPIHLMTDTIPDEVRKQIGPHSGIVPTMLSYQLAGEVTTPAPGIFTESLFLAWRVAIGYDDEREVLHFHDPSFGPAWEVGYEVFQRIVAAVTTSACWVPTPTDAVSRLGTRPRTGDYRSKTTSEVAAEHFITGYALACAGQLPEATQRFRQGLSLPGLSPGYRHLFLVELGLHAGFRGDCETAISLLCEAVDLVPENHRAWSLLGEMYSLHAHGNMFRKLASLRARWKANRLERGLDREDSRISEALHEALPSDFLWWQAG